MFDFLLQMSNLTMIQGDGVFLADHINIDRLGTIKSIGEDSFICGLPFVVLQMGTQIN